MHPAVVDVLQHFTYEHLPDHLQEVSQPFCELAMLMAKTLPTNPQTTMCLWDLLRSKDCAVRAKLAKEIRPTADLDLESETESG